MGWRAASIGVLLSLGAPHDARARGLLAKTKQVSAVAPQRSGDRSKSNRKKGRRRNPAVASKRPGGRAKLNRGKQRQRRKPGLKQLVAAPGLRVFAPARAWGTQLAIDRLLAAVVAHREAFPKAGPVYVHDLSRRRGGRMRSHRSHRKGRDADIRLPQDPPSQRYTRATPRTLHKPRTWFLVKHLVDSCDVELIFLDRRLQRALRRHARAEGVSLAVLRRMFQGDRRDPRIGVVQHWRGHENHMHVRFRSQGRPLATSAARLHCEARQAARLAAALRADRLTDD